MKLYILGENKDDKGTQLEQLTCKLLEFQGYRNVVTNVQVSGASELDVTAEKKEITGVREIITPVICECKAHEKPIVMTDWLKFIGKLHIERKKNPRTIGLMLALSGANGAVIGSATKDFQDDPSIQLIANDDLVKLISDIFHLPEPNVVKDRLATLPIPPVADISLVYYHSTIWWIVGFSEGKYTICHADTKPASAEEVQELLAMLPSYSVYLACDFVDVWNSVETIIQLRQIEKLILLQLIKTESQAINAIVSNIKNVVSGENIDEPLVIKAIQGSSYLQYNDSDKIVALKAIDDINFADFYRYLLSDSCPIEALSTQFYKDHINESLLEQIWQIQGGFKIPDDQVEKFLSVIRCSPGALLYSLCPDKFLEGAKHIQEDEGMRNLYISHFWSSIQKAFIEDYHNSVLGSFYYNDKKMLDIQISTSLNVHILEKEGIEINVMQSFALAKLDGTEQIVLINTKP